MKKGSIKTEDKSYQLQKLAEQRKMATVSPTGQPLSEPASGDDAVFLSSRAVATIPLNISAEKKARTWLRSLNIVELMKQERAAGAGLNH